MAAPNLTVAAEPRESGAIVFLPLAAPKSGASAKAQLSLKLAIKNNESQQVKATQLRLTFPASAVGASEIPLDLTIAAGGTSTWFFQTANNVLLPSPAPGTMQLEVTCQGFSAPATVSYPLAAHRSPTPVNSFVFPAAASDLRSGEYWTGRSSAHAPAGDGGQLFAYDVDVVAWDGAKWTNLLPGKDGTRNEHYRVWGKPIRAMADGTVVAFSNDIPTNPSPPADLSPPNPVEGCHFYVQHGDELMLYAHFQTGSLSPPLMKKGASVKKGDFLGLAGNSGNSTNPHLHIHTIQATAPWSGPPRPLPFQDIRVVDRTLVHPPDPSAPWVKADDRGLPEVSAAIWPLPTAVTWYPPGWSELARHGIPSASYQTEFDRITGSGYRPVWIDGYDVNGSVFLNAIFRPDDGTPWVARHGLTGDQYQAEFTIWTQQGFRLAHIESYLAGGGVRYAPIFVKAPGPAWVAYHGRDGAAHQRSFDDLTRHGYRPVNISVVHVGGNEVFAALYEQKDVGGFWAKSGLTAQQYQAEWSDQNQAARNLAYLAAYDVGGSPRFSAIWFQKAPNEYARHGLTSQQYQAEFDSQSAKGLLTRAVTGYEESGEARFAAYWTK